MEDEKEIIWEGDSKDVLMEFPDGVRQDLGYNLHRLQNNQEPLDSKPLAVIGKGVFELRDKNDGNEYRLIYYVKIKNKIHVLHCFTKKEQQTAPKDIKKGQQRLKALTARLDKEKKDEK